MLQALSLMAGIWLDAGAHDGPEAFVGLSRRAKFQPDTHGTADFHRGMANKAWLAPNIWVGREPAGSDRERQRRGGVRAGVE